MTDSDSPLLTAKQRRALEGDFGELDKTARTRLRNRIISVLQDFSTVNEHLPAAERAKIFKKALGGDLTQNLLENDSQATRFMYALSAIHEFLWAGLRQNDWTVEQHERLLEETIRRVEQDRPPGMVFMDEDYTEVSVDVTIDIARRHYPSPEQIIERFEQGHRLTDADAKRILTSVPKEELLELLIEYNDVE